MIKYQNHRQTIYIKKKKLLLRDKQVDYGKEFSDSRVTCKGKND